MKARYLLDSRVLIRHLGGRSVSHRICNSVRVFAGMHEHERYKTKKLLSRFITFDLDSDIAERAGDYIRRYRSQGYSLAVPDAIIAATAVQHGVTLVTFNVKDFSIPGLSLFQMKTTDMLNFQPSHDQTL